MFKKLFFFLPLALSACTLPVMDTLEQGRDRAIEMLGMSEAAGVMVYTEDGAETYLAGQMHRQLNGEVFINVSGPDLGECEGLISERLEVVSINCENGYAFTDELTQDVRQSSGIMELSGTTEGQAYIAFFGWGVKSSEAELRSAFVTYTSEI